MSDDWRKEAEEGLREIVARREAKHKERLALYETFILNLIGLFSEDRPSKDDVMALIGAFREREAQL